MHRTLRFASIAAALLLVAGCQHRNGVIQTGTAAPAAQTQAANGVGANWLLGRWTDLKFSCDDETHGIIFDVDRSIVYSGGMGGITYKARYEPLGHDQIRVFTRADDFAADAVYKLRSDGRVESKWNGKKWLYKRCV